MNAGQKRKSMARLKDNYGNEFNSTGSLLSDLSVTLSEEGGLDESKRQDSVNHLSFNSTKRSRIAMEKRKSSMIKSEYIKRYH